MSITARSKQILLCIGVGTLIFSTAVFAQFDGVGTAIGGVSYTSTLTESAVSTGGWISLQRSALTYSGKNPAEEIVQTIIGRTSWLNKEKYAYVFSGNKIQTVAVTSWDTTASAWTALGNFTFTWAGSTLSQYSYTGKINVGDAALDATVTAKFVYNNANKMTSDSSVIALSMGTTTTKIVSASTYTYGSGYSLKIASEWDEATSAYVASGKDSTILCSDDLDSLSFSFTWTAPNWVPDERHVTTYNSNRTLSAVLNQTPSSAAWVNKDRTTYGYGSSAVARTLASRMQAAQQKAAQKLLSLKGTQYNTAGHGMAFNVQGRQCASRAAALTGFVIVKNQVPVQH